MANQLFAGFMLTGAGVAINGATVDLFDRNTTTPVRATTTTDANGYWTISHATEGRFDVRMTNLSTVLWRKYDTSQQMTALEVQTLRIRNPAFTFDYDIVPAAITADRQLNLPLITATDTIAVLALAQTFLTGVKTFNSSILAIRNPADTFSYTLVASAITATRNLTLPLITAADTLAVLGLAQTFTADKTFTAANLVFLTGKAVTGTEYSVGEDADATPQLHLNVPTGAGFELSINDAAAMTLVTNILEFLDDNMIVRVAARGATTTAGREIDFRAGDGGSATTGGAGGRALLRGGVANGTGNNNGGRVLIMPGTATGTGLKPLVELVADGGVPTTAVLFAGAVGFKYNAAGTLVAYVNDAGIIKSLSLGTPA